MPNFPFGSAFSQFALGGAAFDPMINKQVDPYRNDQEKRDAIKKAEDELKQQQAYKDSSGAARQDMLQSLRTRESTKVDVNRAAAAQHNADLKQQGAREEIRQQLAAIKENPTFSQEQRDIKAADVVAKAEKDYGVPAGTFNPRQELDEAGALAPLPVATGATGPAPVAAPMAPTQAPPASPLDLGAGRLGGIASKLSKTAASIEQLGQQKAAAEATISGAESRAQMGMLGVDVQQAQAVREFQEQGQKKLARDQQDAALRIDNARRAEEDAAQRLSAAQKEYEDYRVDPNRLYSTPGRRIGSMIAIALSGIGDLIARRGVGPAGPNRAMEILQMSVDRDINAQQQELQSLGQKVGSQRNILGELREKLGSEVAARNALQGMYYDSVQKYIQELNIANAPEKTRITLEKVSDMAEAKKVEAYSKSAIETQKTNVSVYEAQASIEKARNEAVAAANAKAQDNDPGSYIEPLPGKVMTPGMAVEARKVGAKYGPAIELTRMLKRLRSDSSFTEWSRVPTQLRTKLTTLGAAAYVATGKTLLNQMTKEELKIAEDVFSGKNAADFGFVMDKLMASELALKIMANAEASNYHGRVIPEQGQEPGMQELQPGE